MTNKKGFALQRPEDSHHKHFFLFTDLQLCTELDSRSHSVSQRIFPAAGLSQRSRHHLPCSFHLTPQKKSVLGRARLLLVGLARFHDDVLDLMGNEQHSWVVNNGGGLMNVMFAIKQEQFTPENRNATDTNTSLIGGTRREHAAKVAQISL